MIRRNLLVFAAATACLALAGCSVAAILTDLENGANEVAKLAPEIEAATGISPTIVNAVIDADTGLLCVTAVADAGGTPLQIGLAIGQCGLTSAAPLIPAGTPTTIVADISAVFATVAQIIKDYPTATAAAKAAAPAGGKVDVGFFGHRKLHSVESKLLTARAQLVAKK